MDEPSGEYVAQDADLKGRDRRNWAASICLIVTTLGASFYWIFSNDAKPVDLEIGALHVLLFNGAVALAGAALLLSVARDAEPMATRYRVMGRPEIAETAYDFYHLGKWTTFTLLSNTLGVLYFWLAAVLGWLQWSERVVPTALARTTSVLWDIVFPMSFLINLVVTFVLIPGMKKMGKFDKLWFILTFKPQALHNGFVLVCALEAVLAEPRLELADFPIVVVYGDLYILFAWAIFWRTGIFHYFFFDPRFKFNPCASLGLLALLTGIFSLCNFAMVLSSQHAWVKAVILGSALATCTFRDKDAIVPSGGAGEL